MLKKMALAAVLAVGSTAAFADKDVGCGIGSQIWAGRFGLSTLGVTLLRHSESAYYHFP